VRWFCISWFWVSRKGGTGGGGWGHLQGAVHMVAARLGFELLSPCRGLVSGKKGYLGSERVYGNR